jgi:hypothetical protein
MRRLNARKVIVRGWRSCSSTRGDAYAAFCQVHPGFYLHWERNEKGHADRKGRRLCLIPQSALVAQRSFARRAIVGWGSYRNRNKEFIQCWIVRVKR